MIHGPLDPNWQKFLPAEVFSDVLEFISESWRRLLLEYPRQHTYEIREEKLTVSLTEYMNDPDSRKKSGILGKFVSEVTLHERHSDGELKIVGRSDINYIHGVAGVPEFTVEFKKLNNSPGKRRLYCYEGIKRFVDGKYARDQNIGAMCALVKGDVSKDVAVLIQYISKPPQANILQCLKNKCGDVIIIPSQHAPGVAEFDTSHKRPSIGGPIIELSHIFLEF